MRTFGIISHYFLPSCSAEAFCGSTCFFEACMSQLQGTSPIKGPPRSVLDHNQSARYDQLVNNSGERFLEKRRAQPSFAVIKEANGLLSLGEFQGLCLQDQVLRHHNPAVLLGDYKPWGPQLICAHINHDVNQDILRGPHTALDATCPRSRSSPQSTSDS